MVNKRAGKDKMADCCRAMAFLGQQQGILTSQAILRQSNAQIVARISRERLLAFFEVLDKALVDVVAA